MTGTAPAADTAHPADPAAAGGRLHMLHLPVDARRLFAFARDQGLAAGRLREDTGYHLHALFAALFGPLAPRPFALPRPVGAGRGDPARLPVLAYSARPLAELRDWADGFALPAVHRAVVWDDAADKPMPRRFPAGLVLGFELRACPVVRLGRGATAKAPGCEVDAYLAALDAALGAAGEDAAAPGRRPGQPGWIDLDRAGIYRDWLAARIAASGCAVPRAIHLVALRRTTVVRRGRRPDGAEDPARPVRPMERPEAVFSGLLEVTAPEAFTGWLGRGIGRHRAFGFGMLLLRPAAGRAGTAPC